MQKKFLTKYRLPFFALGVVVTAFFVVWGNFRGLYFAGGDQSLYINPLVLWKDSLFAWDRNSNYLLGGPNFWLHNIMPLLLFYKIFPKIPPTIIQHAYFTLVFSCIAFTSFFYFYKYLFKSKFLPSLFSTMLYFFNNFFFVTFVTYNVHLSYAVLPLLLITFHQICEGKTRKSMLSVLLLSVVFPAAFINPPAVIPSVVVSFFYLCFLVSKRIRLLKSTEFYRSVVADIVVFFFLNIWWLFPLIKTMLFEGGGGLVEEAVGYLLFGTTSLFDAFRFLGGWAFNPPELTLSEGRYDSLYYSLIFIALNYLVVSISFLSLRFVKKNHNILFFFLWALLALFLAKGDLAPMGNLYSYAFKNFPGFVMFREPYTKFMQIYVFPMAALLGYFVYYFRPSKYRKPILSLILLAMLFPSFPFVVGGFVPSRGNIRSVRSYLVKIPEYLLDFDDKMRKDKLDYKLLALPMLSTTRLWEHGANVTILRLGLNYKPVFSDRVEILNSDSPDITKSVYSAFQYTDPKFSTLLGLLNIRKVFLNNDVDWRYSSKVNSPNKRNYLIEKSGLVKSYELGKFTEDYLKKIPNTEKDLDTRNEVYAELINRPAVVLYDIEEKVYLPHFYIPKETIYAKASVSDITTVIASGEYDTRSNYIFSQESEDSFFAKIANHIVILGEPSETLTSINVSVWNNSWSWPDPSVNPESRAYSAVKIKERMLLNRASEPEYRMEILSCLSVKRVSEIIKYPISRSTGDVLVLSFLDLHDQLFELINTELDGNEENLKYWNSVGKYYMYFVKAVFALRNSGFSSQELDSRYEDFRSFLDDHLRTEGETYLKNDGDKFCGSNCFYFDIPLPGTYDLFVDSHSTQKKLMNVETQDVFTTKYIFPERDNLFSLPEFNQTNVTGFYKINGWEPVQSYKVSFDYKIEDGTFFFGILEDSPDYSDLGQGINDLRWDLIEEGKFSTVRKYLANKEFKESKICIDSTEGCFSHYESIIESSYNSRNGYVYLKLPEETDSTRRVEIRNFVLEKYQEQPKMLLKKTQADPASKVPSIEFRTVNQTKYRVKISGATEPYFLVFSEAYNNGWKVYLSGADKKSSLLNSLSTWAGNMLATISDASCKDTSIIAKYFDGEIVERDHCNTFLEPATFETWGGTPVAEGKQIRSNGYANSWYITPEDVSNLTDYELIIEYTPQKTFYILQFVSLTAFSLSLLYLVASSYYVYRKSKK